MSQTDQKVAIVTGGSRGIGAAIVERLARDGYKVVFTFVSNEQKAIQLADKVISNGGKAKAVRVDSANTEELTKLVSDTAEEFGRLDALVNNAGVFEFGPIDEINMKQLERTLDINIKAVFVATQEALKHMVSGGRIINIGSCNAERIPIAGGSVYTMSKAAISGFTKGLARDLGHTGITVNNVQPGPVDTDMNPADGPASDLMLSAMALDRFGKTEEIASMVSYLAGPESGFVTGANLTIDGGYSA